jgi:hypothetical protein
MVEKHLINNTKKANTKDGYYIAKRNTQGTEKTQIMEWLTVAHIDSLNSVEASDGDTYVKIPIEKMIENNVVSETRPGRDVMRLHREMAKLMVNLETTRKRSNGDIGTVYTSVVVFPEVSYDPLDREVTIKISGKATPQFYSLSDLAHTSLNLDIVLKNITGFWARKIYAICREQLYHNSDIIEFNMSLKDFRSALGIHEDDKCQEFKAFNRYILTPALWELGWDLAKQKHIPVGTPKKPVADIDLFIRASKIVVLKKVTGIKFQVRPKVMNQPSLIGRAPESITAPTKQYLTSINWSQWSKINQLGETYGSLVIEKAIVNFRENYAGNAKKNVAGLLHEQLPTLIENALNNQTKEERKSQRNQRGKVLLEEWKLSHPFDTWVKDQKETMAQIAKQMNRPIPENLTYTEMQWVDAGVAEVKKALDKEEYEQKQQRLF